MGIVMIKCPETGREISTGMVADRARFHATPVFFALAYCPHCRTHHEWFAQQAWVSEAEDDRVAMSYRSPTTTPVRSERRQLSRRRTPGDRNDDERRA